MAVPVELCQWLGEQGFGTFDELSTTGNIFDSVLPESPDAAIAVYLTGGPPSSSALPMTTPTCQIVVRGSQDSRDARDRAQAIYEALQAFTAGFLTVGGIWIAGVKCLQAGPVHIGQDANLRHLFSLNFLFYVGV